MLYYNIMKKHTSFIYFASSVLLLCLTAGCNSTPVRQSERALLPVNQARKGIVLQRAAALRRVLAPMELRGAGITLNAYRNRIITASEMMKLVKELGFNRIFCHITSETELSDDLKELLAAASKAGLPVELTLRQGDFKHRFRGNALVRTFLPQFRTLPDLARDIVEFNNALPAQCRLAGVTVRFEPHLLSYANSADKIPGLLYIWNNSSFGPGLDNDKLVKLCIVQLQQMKANLKGLPLSVELPDFYPRWVKEGKLSTGRARDFKAVGRVMIQCSGNLPSELVSFSSEAFAGEKKMSAVIPLAGHTSIRSGALRRRNWNDLTAAVGFFVNSTRKQNCSGVVLRPLSELGYMLLEQD